MNEQTAGTQSGHPVAARDLPAILSLIAGMVDVTSWLTLGGLFAAHITGNLVIIAADLFTGRLPHATQVLAVPMFVVAVAAAEQIGRVSRSGQTGSVNLLLFVQAFLLIGVAGVCLACHASAHPFSPAAGVAGMLAVSSMAVQNALLHLAKKYASTTAVMTGNLVVCTLSLLAILRGGIDREEARQRWTATWPLLVGFVTGCLIGSLAVSRAGVWAWMFPAMLSVVVAVFFWRTTNRPLYLAALRKT
jgi:uncharacterized membrane protein YoaK (UPF0700 family)